MYFANFPLCIHYVVYEFGCLSGRGVARAATRDGLLWTNNQEVGYQDFISRLLLSGTL